MKKLFVGIVLVFTVLLEVDVIDSFSIDYDYYQDSLRNRPLREVRDVDQVDDDMEQNSQNPSQNNDINEESAALNADDGVDKLAEKSVEIIDAAQQELNAAGAASKPQQDAEQVEGAPQSVDQPSVVSADANDVELRNENQQVDSTIPSNADSPNVDQPEPAQSEPQVHSDAPAQVPSDVQVHSNAQVQSEVESPSEVQVQSDVEAQPDVQPQSDDQAQSENQPQAVDQPPSGDKAQSDDQAQPDDESHPDAVPSGVPAPYLPTIPADEPQRRSVFRYRRARNDGSVPDWERRDLNRKTQALIRLAREIISDEEERLYSKRFYRDESAQDGAEGPPTLLQGTNQQVGEQSRWMRNLRLARDPPEDVGGLELARLVRSILVEKFDGTDGDDNAGDHGSGHASRRIYF